MSDEQSGLDRAMEILREYDRLRCPGVIHTNSGPPFTIPTPEPAAQPADTGADDAEQEQPPEDELPPDGRPPWLRRGL